MCKLIFDNNFEHIIDLPANFVSVFTDSEDKNKFTKFLKDVWCYFHSLLANPVVDHHTQECGKVEDHFEYYATMCVDPSDIPPALSNLKRTPVYMHT